jgi:glycosyltransferase involved in cell wall biosynthesis
MRLIPYPLRTEGDVLTLTTGDGSVMTSGRAACDWPTVFDAARGEDWPLTVVCGKRDLRQVNRLNADGRATVLTDISLDYHFRLVQQASVYLLALRSFEVSSGQIRLSDAIRAGTPAVVSVVPGIAGYVEDGRTVLSYPSGDAAAARRQICRLLEDPALAARLSEQAFEGARAWTRERYRLELQAMITEAFAEAQHVSFASV